MQKKKKIATFVIKRYFSSTNLQPKPRIKVKLFIGGEGFPFIAN